jgi:RimJ/RimL family protein N-acetyltransferase
MTNRIYSLVIVAWVVIFLQLSVKYWRNGFVYKAVDIYLKYFFKNYLLIVKKLINQINNQIKLY